MRWIVLFIVSQLLAGQAQAQDLQVIQAEAAQCREDIGDLFDGSIPWDCQEEPAQTLTEAIRLDAEFLGKKRSSDGAHNPACDALIQAGLHECSYSVRVILAQFLAMYGVDLFPSEDDFFVSPGRTTYSGKGEENAVLIKSVKRNSALFADGDLTAAEVAEWR